MDKSVQTVSFLKKSGHPLVHMFPRNYAAPVPPAGISTKSGEGAAGCFYIDDSYRGTNQQQLYRSHHLGAPGERMHTPGVTPFEAPEGMSFGVQSQAKNYSVADCVGTHAGRPTAAQDHLDEVMEAGYHRSKQKLGAVPDGVAQIPDELKQRGFGVSTRFGESAAAVIQGSHTDTLRGRSNEPGYQTNRNYRWQGTGIDPVNYTFGIKGSGNVDHLTGLLHQPEGSTIVPTAVERHTLDVTVQDPDPVDPMPNTRLRTMTGAQVRRLRDPADLPPAGLPAPPRDFNIGDTIKGMGAMDSFDVDSEVKERNGIHVPDIVFGVPTRPNPFPNPLRGPGRYYQLGLSDEDFLLLRDKAHIVPVMVKALCLSEEEASTMFDACSAKYGRDKISVSEFYDEFKSQ